MSRATISGSVIFNTNKNKAIDNQSSSDTCHIVILDDFSGRDHRGLNNVDSIKQRKIIEVDCDNFDQVFSKFDVQCSLPIAEQAMHFEELDDMHPDFIYQHIPLFDQLRSLRAKLNSTATFADAAKEIYQWYTPEESTDTSEKSTDTPSVASASIIANEQVNGKSLLDDILSNTTETLSPSAPFDAHSLIKDIIAPYVTPKPDPRQNELLEMLDEATSNLMRKIMHHRQFQDIESTWRSLFMLVQRIETNQQLKLFIIDVSQQEVIEDALATDNLEQSHLYKLLVEKRTAVGTSPFDVIMHGAIFGNTQEDINGLGHLGSIASSCGAMLIAGGTEQLAGCNNLAQTPDKDDWNSPPSTDVSEAWEKLRTMPQALNTVLVAPRFLNRMPYGKKTEPIENFDFEELPANDKHPYYLWSSGAWLVTLLLAQNYTFEGNMLAMKIQQIDQLPLHVYHLNDEMCVTPCAEVNLLNSSASALQQAGLMTIRSIMNKDSVMIPTIQSIQK